VTHPIVQKFLAGENDAGGTIIALERELEQLEQIAERMATEIQASETSQQAYEAAVEFRNWKKPLTPIPGTDHTEEAW